MNRRPPALQWDIFCKVIDNFGDIGVSWRLAADLASRGQRVRLWVDDASALAWMCPEGAAGVQLLEWTPALQQHDLASLENSPCDVMLEAFGCDIAPEFIAVCIHHSVATGHKPLWINLEYLSAEAYVARCHGLPSLLHSGPAAGWTRWFFYPGFNAQTGGLLRETDLASRQAAFDRTAWLASQGIVLNGELVVSLFCYEPPALEQLLWQLMRIGQQGQPVRLLVAAGRAQQAVKAALSDLAIEKTEHADYTSLSLKFKGHESLLISYLPLLTQHDFDHLLWASDINFVRGEDSVIRALWAGKPFVWQIYPQDDGAHSAKLDAFLDMLGAPDSLRVFHHQWNDCNWSRARTESAEKPAESTLPALGDDLPAWTEAVLAARSGLMAQDDLSSSLLQFVNKNR
ncbi:MAG: elongation factor P maturation arginine rhamnosyltransferase EarP [Pseudomonadota bacterium]